MCVLSSRYGLLLVGRLLATDELRRRQADQLTLDQGWYLTSSVGWFYVSFGFFLGISGILMAAVNFGAQLCIGPRLTFLRALLRPVRALVH